MSNRRKVYLLAVTACLLLGLFLFMQINGDWDYSFPRRLKKMAAILVTGYAVAYSSLLFQTITDNRILTPSIIGFDALYMLIQTVTLFVFGAKTSAVMANQSYFLLNIALMILFASLLYRALFRREAKNIYFVLLAGLICGTLFRSVSSFMLMVIDPNEFYILQDKMFASFNQINTDLLLIATAGVVLATGYSLRFFYMLDVLALGKDHSQNLGIDHDSVVGKLMMVIAVLVAISTALVGPITFLGLLVVNITYQFLHTYRHRYLVPGAVLISVIALLGGVLLVERVFSFSTNLTVIINFIGGTYFIYLMLREGKGC
jgi:iron complex transport system permease protein